MSIQQVEVKVYKEYLVCDDCGEKMIWNGLTLTSYPEQYDHHCPGCGKVERTKGACYPKTKLYRWRADDMTETVLFVGGSLDGRRAEMDISTHSFNAHLPEDVEKYRRELVYGPRKAHPVFLFSAVDKLDLIPLLIEGYRRKE
jgi:predicted RNA-binding Zn-ribbon protein involved in translation (DUF1610 family)